MPPPSTGDWASLQSDDLRVVVARLRAGGYPGWLVRALVQAELDFRYGARLRGLSQQTDPNVPFWKSGPVFSFDPQRIAEYSRVSAERAKLERELLGDLADENLAPTAEQRRRYGNLPAAKIAQIERINQDYFDLNREMRAAMKGITLPEDRQKFLLLEREQRADLAALLTPEELADFDLRNSPVTERLRPAFSLFKVTEEEFRAIHELQQPYARRIEPGPNTFMLMTPDERRNFTAQQAIAQQELDAAMRSKLGDARFAEFTRASDYEFRQLNQFVARENLSPKVAIEAFDLRTRIAEESQRIANEPSLSFDEKVAALNGLGQNARAQFRTILGPGAGEAYLQRADRWITSVERGGVVTFNSNGWNTTGLERPNSAPSPSRAAGAGAGVGPANGATGPAVRAGP